MRRVKRQDQPQPPEEMRHRSRAEIPPEEILAESDKGIITTGDIERSIEEFTDTLPNPEVLEKPGHKSFNNLLRYIHKHNIRYVIPNTYNIDYSLLDDIFINIYIPLCYKYNRIPSVNNYYANLLLQDYDIVYDIKQGIYRGNGNKVNKNTSLIVKKWISICNGELIDDIMHTGNVGGIFTAKTRGFTDQPQAAPLVQVALAPSIDAKQLEAIRAGLPEIGQE